MLIELTHASIDRKWHLFPSQIIGFIGSGTGTNVTTTDGEYTLVTEPPAEIAAKIRAAEREERRLNIATAVLSGMFANSNYGGSDKLYAESSLHLADALLAEAEKGAGV